MLGTQIVREALPPRPEWMPSAEVLEARLTKGRLADARYRTRLAEYVCSLLPAKGRCKIIDVGAGEGQLASIIQGYRPNTTVTCVDTYIRARRERNVKVVQIDGAHLPFSDGSFDVALLINVLHHADNLAGLLEEVQRVTRSRVIIKDHLSNSWTQRQKLAVLDVLGNLGSGAVVKGRYLSDPQWERLFAGLRGIRVGRYDDLPFRGGWARTVFPDSLEIMFTLDR